eukprot:scaffold130313_cov39-Tisochrysis_lutea.AAC.4
MRAPLQRILASSGGGAKLLGCDAYLDLSHLGGFACEVAADEEDRVVASGCECLARAEQQRILPRPRRAGAEVDGRTHRVARSLARSLSRRRPPRTTPAQTHLF